MLYLVLGYPEPFWGAQGLCRVLVGIVYYARGRFPQEKESIYTIPTAPSCSRSQFLGVGTACVPSVTLGTSLAWWYWEPKIRGSLTLHPGTVVGANWL